MHKALVKMVDCGRNRTSQAVPSGLQPDERPSAPSQSKKWRPDDDTETTVGAENGAPRRVIDPLLLSAQGAETKKPGFLRAGFCLWGVSPS